MAKTHHLISLLFLLISLPAMSVLGNQEPLSAGENGGPAGEAKKRVAIFPIQKSVAAPLYLSSQPSLFKALKNVVRGKRWGVTGQVDYDPDFVPKTLAQMIVQRVFRHEFLVFTPEQVEPYFEHLAVGGKELELEQLNSYFGADGFLMVRLTEWDAANFDRDGKVRVGFEAALIDASNKQVVWSNRAEGLSLKVPSREFLYEKYQRDILSDLARRILSGFPSGSWASNKT